MTTKPHETHETESDHREIEGDEPEVTPEEMLFAVSGIAGGERATEGSMARRDLSTLVELGFTNPRQGPKYEGEADSLSSFISGYTYWIDHAYGVDSTGVRVVGSLFRFRGDLPGDSQNDPSEIQQAFLEYVRATALYIAKLAAYDMVFDNREAGEGPDASRRAEGGAQ